MTRSKIGRGEKSSAHPLFGKDLRFSDFDTIDDRNYFTIILGRNSIGKSQLLSDIAESLCLEIGEFTSRRSSSLNISMTTSSGQNLTEIVMDGRGSSDGKTRPRDVLPNRIVASATTPFDKFRLSRDVIRERVPYRDDESMHHEQRYYYVGLRDTNGRTNFRSAILRTIRGIFLNETRTADQLSKVKLVFEFLGLRPVVQVAYSLGVMSSARRLIEDLISGNPIDHAVLENSSTGKMNRLGLLLQTDPTGLDRVRRALLHAKENYDHGPFQGRIEVEIGQDTNAAALLSELFLLKDLRLLNFREVFLRRHDDGDPLEILQASSGEISIISGILGIASGIQDSSLILIDEPEISLHPEWQDRYLELLRETFSAFRGCHFIVATHSPIIVSDAKKEDTTVLNLTHVLDGSHQRESHFARSIDEIVATQFGVIDDDNLYVKQEIIRAANAIARGEVGSLDFKRRLAMLKKLSKDLGASSKLGRAIDDISNLTK
ncbi:putative AbiEii toxin of type IV toxin-antitoxin system [Primorskyibacter sedentarius]|uniref:Putative AbiEii toxin of type IV toxin-antitoxin system n=1 Tax=Primorskyibacter sedentarius TaxID=745311 RepID=A0A4V2UMT9_9RHOB|nr:AAA family ATPase [Primorskyibacter sedentarius]TCS58967.1 putative AbiEii toxin of type IV toxin-antitoxin system [Primorskyibacter sedentarius]